ncbi:DMT family transporter [Jiella marina]|uniref:DMT family transporter n=1 Tax=Jiella sp. LLJ827 TaxID=2917712 RepID=UPI0021006D56|nr:DMT family transporter [Jiella sp. LLJ827]MCQ0989725.1 DMT family transporter [Jiella sp. LLJ827]
MPRFLVHPYVVLSTVALLWAGNAIAGKLAAGHISPMLLTLFRWTFASLFILPFALGDVKRDWPVIRPRLAYMLALGAIGFSSFNALFYLAVNYTTAINVTIEQSAMPLVVFLANFLLFRMGVAPLQIAGFSLTLVGVALTTSHGDLSALLELDLNRGDALMMLAVLLYGGYTVALRFKPQIHWRSTIMVLSLAALLTAMVFAAIEFALGKTQLPDLQGAGAALYTAIFPSLLAQSLYIKGVEMIGPNRANLFINFVPVFGAILAVLIVGEELFLYHIIALACVLGGITIAERGARRLRAG